MAKPAKVSVLMSIRDDGRGISFFGDLHPSFAGNVVKAMASAKDAEASKALVNFLRTPEATAAMRAQRMDPVRP